MNALTGVYATTNVPEDSYILKNGTSGVGFAKVTSSSGTVTPAPDATDITFIGTHTVDGAIAMRRFINGQEDPSLERLHSIADALGVRVRDLFCE